MAWALACAAALAVAAVFWSPGLAVLVSLRARPSWLVVGAVAPSLTLALAGLVSIAAEAVHVPWQLASVATFGLVVLAGSIAAARRRPAAARLLDAPGYHARRLVLAVLGGIGLQLVPLVIGLRDPRAVFSGYDVAGHLNSVALIRSTGHASSLHGGAVNTLDGSAGSFDAAAWHAMVALIGWPDHGVVFTVAFLVLATVAWTCGVTLLAQTALPGRPRAHLWAAALSGVGIGVPATLGLAPGGIVPNAVANALVPGALALILVAARRPSARAAILAAGAFVGCALTHPNTAFTLLVAVAPVAAVRLAPAARRATRTARGRLVLLGSAAAAAAAFAIAATALLRRGLVAWEFTTPSPAMAVLDLLSGQVGTLGAHAGYLVVACAAGGLFLARTLRNPRDLMLALGALVVLYAAMSTPAEALDLFKAPWYGEARRIASPLAAAMIPFAALALATAPRALLRALARSRPRVPTTPRAAAILGALAVALTAAPGPLGLAHDSATTFQGVPGQPSQATIEEALALRRLAPRLTEGAVLSSPLSGGLTLFGLAGVPVVPRSSFPTPSADVELLGRRLGDLLADPQVCAAARRLDVAYVYIDPTPVRASPIMPNLTRVPAGATLIGRAGPAAIYRLPECAATA